MPVVFFLLCKLVVEAMRVVLRKAREIKPVHRCAPSASTPTCSMGQRVSVISCTYGGMVRPMKLDVLYCIDYQARASLAPAPGRFRAGGRPSEDDGGG